MGLKYEDFKAGEYYLNARGEVIKVIGVNSKDDEYPVETKYKYHTETGRVYSDGEHPQDLIAHIPAPVMFEFLRIIEAYHQNDSFKTILENCYANHLAKKEK